MKFYTAFNFTKEQHIIKTPHSHGMWGSRTHNSWHHMKQRCLNPKNISYKSYGGRGIGVCESWLNFESFISDMGERPNGCDLDRINTNQGYSRENCRWATKVINSFNRRRSIKSDLPRGVSKSGKGYRAFITINYKQYHLGCFPTVEESHEQYRKIAIEWFGFVPDYVD